MNIIKIILALCVVLYVLSMLFIFLYSLAQGYLVWVYLLKRRKRPAQKTFSIRNHDWPYVTVQLPVYNEKYVVARLIDAIAALDYPMEKLEIQLLDDSTDETVEIIVQKVEEYSRKNFIIEHLRRKDRKGYKAGALEEGLQSAKGEFIAIFDADFLPNPDFLKQTIPHFSDAMTGMVQTRWEHLNRNYSLLTRVQAFALDAHFTVEQTGRNASGCFMNFNGTAGVWRKDCILDAGNWQSDTLTEDLDLSYRAQLKGWKFVYLEDLHSPAELPILMSDVKSQQYRWTKGGTETARKLLGRVLRSDQCLKIKWQATFHLLNTFVFPATFCAAICSVPMLFVPGQLLFLKPYFGWMVLFLLSFLLFGVVYYVAAAQSTVPGKRLNHFVSIFPLFLALSMGLSLHNTVAVFAGWSGKKTPFIRTPKFNISQKQDSWKRYAAYLQGKISMVTWMEGMLILYFAFGAGYGFYLHDFSLLLFHLILASGFGIVFLYSVGQYYQVRENRYPDEYRMKGSFTAPMTN